MQAKIDQLIKALLPLIENPRFEADTALFQNSDFPIIITDRDNDICLKCPQAGLCTAKMDVCIPLLGRFVFSNGYTGDVDSLIALLTGVSDLIKDYSALSEKSDDHEFYRLLIKKVIDLNPHALSIEDSGDKLIYQNIIAQNERLTSEQKSNAVSFPIYSGAKKLGAIQFSQSQSFSVQSAVSANSSRDTAFHHILGTDPSIANCIAVSKQVAATNSTVLILGESGTGKEVFANAIHKGSQRTGEPFVAVNCAAIPENLLESELFGYADGAFTGAKKGGKAGKIAAADRGTLFLDEIGDLPLTLQPKLLRVLQERKVEPIGSLKSQTIDIRFICATNKNIEELVKQKLFREDLYYRINVIPIHMPPLRTRTKDIRILIEYNIKKYCILNEKPFKYVLPDLMTQLAGYKWKGNVRELENVAEYAVTMCNTDCITIEHLPVYLKKALLEDKTCVIDIGEPVQKSRPKIIQSFGRAAFVPDDDLAELIEKHGFTTEGKKRIAQELNISLATLYRRIKKLREVEDLR